MDSEIEKAVIELGKGILNSLNLKEDLPNLLANLKDALESKEAADEVIRKDEIEELEERIAGLGEELQAEKIAFADALQLIIDRVPDAKLKAVLQFFAERIKLEEKFISPRWGQKSLELLATLSLTDS